MEKNEEKGIFVRTYNWFRNLTLQGLLGAILLAFIVIIILLSVSYIPSVVAKISSSLSAALYSVFVPAENATVTSDKKLINSGEDFTINFKKGDITDGLFTISYPCNSNLDLSAVESNGLKNIDCDAPYYLLGNETSIKIRPETSDSVVRLVITAAFENNNTQKSEDIGVIRVTIKNDSVGVVTPITITPTLATTTHTTPATTTPTTPTPKTPAYTPPTVVTPAYVGKPDLAVRMLQVGKLDPATNALITSQTQFNYSDTVGIKFEVRNDGDATVGPWTFTASLPSLSTPTYNSSTQISLRPGESIIFTLGFSNLTNQNISAITINVDPQNNVYEDVEYNNIVTSTITNVDYKNSYYNNINNNNNYNYYPNGCYINGLFTYNCSNYNYNNNWNSSDLEVSCYGDPDNPSTDERMHWYADVSGGDGDYSYTWTGSNSLDSSSHNPSKTYTSTGTKRAYVTVEDGDGNSAEASCSIRVD